MQTNQKIPEGWSVKKLEECFSFSAGGDVDKDCFSETKDDLHPYPIYANALTNEGLYGYSSKYKVKEECITITGRGDIGKVFYRKGYFTPIVRLITAIPNTGINAKFMSYACSQIHFFDESTGVPQLTVPQVQWYKILLPPLQEQDKIAKILGTWDEAIEKLSDLIEQKKRLKKGLMQKLLTGKTRLPGFTQPWKEVKLGEAVKRKQVIIEKGRTLTSESIIDGNIPVIAGGKTSPYYHNNYTHNMRCITISASGAYAGFVWKHNEPIWASDCNVLYGANYNTNFLGHYLEYNQEKIYTLQTGGAQPHVYASDIKVITIPDITLDEQQAIADVLSTADDEINLLNQKLEALKAQKKGLMQQLLTGQIRVKVN